MNDITRSWILPALPLLCLLAGCQQPSRSGSSTESYSLGVAEIDITPPVGSRMAGYFNERLATGTHDPLHAKAIVLRQGAEQVALVSCDLLGFTLSVTTNARAQASARTGIPVSNIVICATHSHTGPLFDGALRDYFHEVAEKKYSRDPQEEVGYPALLIERLIKVICAAQASLRPAQLQAGITTQPGLSFNRRPWRKNGKVGE